MKINSAEYTTGAVILSIAVGIMTTIGMGFLVLGTLCIVAAFLNKHFT